MKVLVAILLAAAVLLAIVLVQSRSRQQEALLLVQRCHIMVENIAMGRPHDGSIFQTCYLNGIVTDADLERAAARRSLAGS